MSEDLVTWLRACLDDDEQVAQAANAGKLCDYCGKPTGGQWRAATEGDVILADAHGNDWVATGPWGTSLHADGEHIARHDPARVLAEVAAKRAVVDEYVALAEKIRQANASYGAWADGRPDPYPGASTSSEDPGRLAGLEFAVLALAQPYRDRPGWRQEWEV